ncbi:unnamed protein product [Closterium sp. NIES-53]
MSLLRTFKRDIHTFRPSSGNLPGLGGRYFHALVPSCPHNNSFQQGALGADVVEELAAGTQAGAFFGLSAAAVKTGMLLATGGPPVFALLGIAVGVSLSSFGFFCQTRGFKEGRAVVVSTCAAVAAMLTAVAAGMAGLGEDLPASARLRMWRFLGWGLILFGIVLLVAAKPPDLVGLAKADAARRKPLHPSPRAPNRSTSPSGLSIGIAAGFPRKYEP